jgi:hypothetical protein
VTRHHSKNFLIDNSPNGENKTPIASLMETGFDQRLVLLLPAFRLLYL